MALGAPSQYIADQQATIRLNLVERVAAYDRELAMKSAIPGTEHFDRLTQARADVQFRVDQLTAFLIHYSTL